jgi:hypothetical protein
MNLASERRHSCRLFRPLAPEADRNVCAPGSWLPRAIPESAGKPPSIRPSTRTRTKDEDDELLPTLSWL